MNLQAVKDTLECAGEKIDSTLSHDLPKGFYDLFMNHGIRLDLIEPGRICCSFKVPQRLLNEGNFMHGGATASLVDIVGAAAVFTVAPVTGVSIEISVSYLDTACLDEELEIEAKVLRVGKTVGVVSVELRKKILGRLLLMGAIPSILLSLVNCECASSLFTYLPHGHLGSL
ncbi:acyl-coenzyme A thioesterase 13 [Cinnamomum micranthum f. kanehirae]|uniref:Acyl-coenzyme A thioesterase 13 n=1 Tax=Cinnamomum micranthum f. kanehirae TaxID=337451 RepID=A0A443NU41_9MAGN|nr:acyl-coenzyme A thioesterase 13 [Cinnamomum micranthum f. kanehirae]